MNKSKKYKKIKITIGILYIIILAIYVFFVFSKFLPSQHDSDINFFGKSIYVLENGQAVSVDYTKQPKKGDKIVCVINQKKYSANITELKTSKEATLEVDINGQNQYYTSQATAGIIDFTIPNLGMVYNFFHSIYGLIIIIVIPFSFILIYQVVRIIFYFKSRNKYDLESEESKINEKANLKDETSTILIPKLGDKNHDNIEQQDRLNDTLDEIKYKMAFQDTHHLDNKYDELIDESNDQLKTLHKYGIVTKNVDGGIDVKIEPKTIKYLKLEIKNDGKLAIKTDNYTANIDMEFNE